MGTFLDLLQVQSCGEDTWQGAGSGPAGKRSFGGVFAAQSLAAECRTVSAELSVTSLHVQFLRAGEASEPATYHVERTHDDVTEAVRWVQTRQQDRLLTTATVSFSAAGGEADARGRSEMPPHPETLNRTGAPGPAPLFPPDEFDIRVDDQLIDGEFIRRLWWRSLVSLPADDLLHVLIAVYVTDLYGIDPILQVHGYSMRDRVLRSATTDSSIWFQQPLRADQWNLLESRSPAAACGRGVMTATLCRLDGVTAATLVHEGLAATR